jgi:hypothetical protein
MLTDVEKSWSGARYELTYHVPWCEQYNMITVVIMFDLNLIPLSRGISICSPIEQCSSKDGYRRAKGRALAAIFDHLNGDKHPRQNAEIRANINRYRINHTWHPTYEASKICKYKIQYRPDLTEHEKELTMRFIEHVCKDA